MQVCMSCCTLGFLMGGQHSVFMVSLRCLQSRALQAMWRIVIVLELWSSRRNLSLPVQVHGTFCPSKKGWRKHHLLPSTGIKLILPSFNKAPGSSFQDVSKADLPSICTNDSYYSSLSRPQDCTHLYRKSIYSRQFKSCMFKMKGRSQRIILSWAI